MSIYQANLKIALSPIEEFLADPRVTDVMVNPDGSVWIQRFRESIVPADKRISYSETIQIINFTAHLLDTEINKDNPTLYGAIPGYGCRIQAQVPPRSPGPAIALRKKNLNVNPLEKYHRERRISSDQLKALKAAIARGENMIISGPINSGKTSLMNAIIRRLP